jgi:uncharacterized protein (TIGR01777 family)
MRVLITGGSGLVGRHLARNLLDGGHQPIILSRRADVIRRNPEMWSFRVVSGDPTTAGPWQQEIDGCDAVVNLAGHNIFAGRWNAEIKRKIRDSRVYGASNLVAAIRAAHVKPKVLVHGSAIGYYGPHGDEVLDETSPSGTDFLAVTCRETEEVSEGIESLGVRRAIVRTGIVLARGEGALKLMTPAFKFGPGVPIGSGSGLVATGAQWMSWIHVDDVVGIFQLAVSDQRATGPLNGTAPNPVTNAEFARTFSAVLRKPYTPWRFHLPVGPPDAVLKLFLGEVAGVMTTGQRVMPAKALGLGYAFKYPALAGALQAILAAKPAPAVPAQAQAAAHADAHHHQ